MEKFNNLKAIKVTLLTGLIGLGMSFLSAKQTEMAQNFTPNPINNVLVQPAEAKPPKSVCTSYCLKTAVRDGNIVCVKKTVSCKPTKDLY